MLLLISIIALFSLFISLAITPFVRAYAIRRNIGDYPGDRKIHTKFIPRLGGLAIILGFGFGILMAYIIYPGIFRNASFNPVGVLGALMMIGSLGIYDDIKGIGSFGKLIVQFIAASIVISSGLAFKEISLPFIEPIDLGIFALPFSLLWFIGITNAFNLLDGLDGLAVGVTAIVSVTFFLIGIYFHDELLIIVTASLFFACIGFLYYNFNPASIFMGDTGSLFLGFLMACLSLQVMEHLSSTTHLNFLVVVIALAVPIVDTSVAFFRRIKKGMHPLKADKEHIHHRLIDLGLTHRQTVVINYIIAFMFGLVAFMLILVDSMYAVIITIVVVVSILVGIYRLGYIEELMAQKGKGFIPIQPLSVAKIIDKAILLFGDVLAIILSFLLSYWFRFQSGLFPVDSYIPLEMYFLSPAVLVLAIGWLFIFTLSGLYEIPWDVSRVDYIFSITKTVVVGTVMLFFITLDPEGITLTGRMTTVFYGVSVAVCIITIRMLIVSIERRYEILGFRRRQTVIVGTSTDAENLMKEIRIRSGLKYNVIGFIDRRYEQQEFLNLPVMGQYGDIPDIVKKHNIEEILVATSYDSREEILEIVGRCNGMVPNVKVFSDKIDILSGFRTEEIIGNPLIRLYPTNMKRWQWIAKRIIDITVSLIILIPVAPIWFLIGILIKIDSRGPVFFIQERVGKRGKIFKLFKFRSMIPDAEKDTGPIWASQYDKRVTQIGRLLRKLRIDEVPQFINVLKGEMSLVGPRPERPFFVEQLKRQVGFYDRRLLVRPGITGWAQVKHRYDTTLDDVKEKIKYDLYYLENMSITLDLKILLRTILVALSGRGTH